MPRPKIRFAVLGRLPPDFDPGSLLDWKSRVFTVDPVIESFQLNEPHEGDDWEYTDAQLENYAPTRTDENFLVVLLNVRLQDNYYVRRLSNNRVLFTFHELDQILRFHNIPLKNIVLRVLYAVTLIYLRYRNRIPSTTEYTSYAHDETRGCLFDMNASKFDVVHSCHEPIVCEHCVAQLKDAKVSNEVIQFTQSDITKIRKPLFHRILDFVKRNPLWSILLSLLTALVVGIIGSLIASFIYEAIGPQCTSVVKITKTLF